MTLYSPSFARPTCRILRTTAQTITTSTPTAVIFESAALDTSTFWAGGSPTRVTIPTAGFYSVEAQPLFAASASGTLRQCWISLNGTTHQETQIQVAPNGTNLAPVNVATSLRLAAGDYLEVFVFHDVGGNLTLATNSGLANPCELSVALLST